MNFNLNYLTDIFSLYYSKFSPKIYDLSFEDKILENQYKVSLSETNTNLFIFIKCFMVNSLLIVNTFLALTVSIKLDIDYKNILYLFIISTYLNYIFDQNTSFLVSVYYFLIHITVFLAIRLLNLVSFT